jgi:hypothetical protein
MRLKFQAPFPHTDFGHPLETRNKGRLGKRKQGKYRFGQQQAKTHCSTAGFKMLSAPQISPSLMYTPADQG